MSLFTATTVEEVKKLIKTGHSVNSIGRAGCSPLHSACEKGYLDIIKVLNEAGANVNKKDYRGFYPIEVAVRAGYIDIVKYFIENYPVKLDNVLNSASAAGNIDVLDYLLTLNLELAKPVFDLAKPVFDLAKLVLDLNSPDKNPLITACRCGHIDVIDRLLYAGVDTNIVDKYYNIAIIIATFKNRLDIIKRLVMFGADYHTYGGKSLVISCHSSYNEISEFLIELGCNVNYCFDNMSPLMHATNNNNLKIVKLLLERGADPNFVNDYGKKAIDYCKSDEFKALFIKN